MSAARVLLPLLLLAAALGAEPQRATVDTTGVTLKPITSGKHAGMRRAEQTFTFHLDPSRYQVRYHAIVDPKAPDRLAFGEGYLGMPAPSSSNWYHGGFLFVRLNGQEVGHTPLHRACVAETGRRAIADFVWDAPAAVVRVRFAGQPGGDRLLCEIALEPKQPVKSLRIGLRCYPSFFTAWHKRDGNRQVLTPTATLKQGQRPTVPAADHWFAVYYDTVFDVARGEGDGPCALLFDPAAVDKVRFDVGSYAVSTELACKPGTRRVRLAFWDLRGTANAAALASFRASAAKWLADLRGLDFTPAAARAFDPQAELAQLDQLSRPPAVRKQLGKRADGFRKQIAALAKSEGKLTILQQAHLLGILADYREFLWELKLAALLATQ